MAKNIIGSELTVEIPNNLFSQFDKLQQALDATAEAAGKTGEKFVDMFKQINTQGIDAYLQKLYDTKVALEAITSQNPRNDSALKQLKTDAAESLDLINKMIDTLSKAYGVKAPTTTTADTKQEIADLQRINELHHERMEAMRQMYRFGQAEASKTTLTEGETAQMSNIKARYDAAQSELNLMRERGDLSTKVMDQMTKNETQFVFAEADLERRRQQTFKDTADKEIKEAERVAKEQEELRRKSYTGAVDFSNNAKTYKEEEQAIRYLKEARANLLQTDADYATKLNTLNEAINRHKENLKQATLTDEQRAKISEENSRRAIEQAKREKEAYERRKKATQDKWFSSSPDRASNFSNSTKSINDQIKAIHYLKVARDNLDKSSMSKNEYKKKIQEINKEIQRQQQEIDRLQNKSRGAFNAMGNAMNGLKGKLAAVFSVQAITEFTIKLVKIRGEMELQQRSLEVLLRSKEEADALWNKTVALAIKSPFTVKELTTYTKQLAAYRIESDKLYETNKRLADISAGLGVDMNRLILAYGQVKAATFLRATELRQFTEAGIPMLEELAEYFTQMEGKAVTVGEVMQRISKRGVMFKDVEEVIKRITDEGGVFYQMQEKQAETTWGLLANLKDRIELMFNDIGAANDGFIKGAIKLMISLIDNWRTWSKVIVPVFSMIGTFFAGKLLVKGIAVLNTMGKTIWDMVRGMIAFKTATLSASATNPLLALATVLVGIVTTLATAFEETDKLQIKINEINAENLKTYEEQIGLYRKLVDVYNSQTSSYKEREKALQQIQSTFKDILPDYMTEIGYIKDITDNYDAAKRAMLDYYNSLAQKQREEAIKSEIVPNIDENIQQVVDEIMNLGEWSTKISRIEVTSIVQEIVDKALEGDIAPEHINDAIIERLQQYLQLTDDQINNMVNNRAFADWGLFTTDMEDLVYWVDQYQHKLKDNERITLATTQAQQRYNNQIANASENAKKYVTNVKNAWIEVRDALSKSNFTLQQATILYKTLGNEAPKEVIDIVEKHKELQNVLGNTNLSELFDVSLELDPVEATRAFNSAIDLIIDSYNTKINDFQEYLRGLNVSELETLASKFSITALITAQAYKGTPEYENKLREFLGYFSNTIIASWEREKSAIEEEFNSTDLADTILSVLSDVQKTGDYADDVFKNLLPDAKQLSLKEFRDKIKEEIDKTNKTINEVKTALAAGVTDWGWLSMLFGVSSQEELDALIKRVEALTKAYEALGGTSQTNSSNHNANKIWKDRIKLIRDMAKAYEDLNKTFADTDAKSRVRESYEDYFNELFGKYKGLGFTIDMVDFTDPEGTKAALERLLDISGLEKTSQAYKDLKEAIAEVSLELERASKVAKDETLKKSIEDLFQDYEISVDLKKMGITKKEANELWGIDMISIDDLRKQLISKREEFVGKDMEKEYEEFLEKLNDMEIKAQHERLKKYTELIKGSYSELGQILIDQQKAFDEIDETFVITADVAVNKFNVPQDKIDALEQPIDELFKTISDNVNLAKLLGVGENVIESIREYNKYLEAQNRLAKEGVILQTQKKREELDFNLFKDSSTYQMMFSDIEHMSDVVLDMIEQKVEDVRKALGDLDATEFKEYQRILKQISDIKIERNPFKAFTESLNEVRKLQEQGLTFDVLQQQVIDLDEEIKNLTNGIAVMEKQQSKATGVMSVVYETTLQAMKARKTQAEGEQQAAENSLQNYYEAIKAEEAKIAKAKEYGQLMMDMYHSMADMFDAMGIGLDDTTNVLDAVANGILNAGMQFLQMAVMANIAGKAIQSAMGPVGWAMMAVTALSGVLTAVFQAKDNGLQKDIERIEKDVEDLEHAFEKLEKQIEKTFNAQSLKTYSDSALRNIEDRYKKTQDMIALEEEKKKTDENAIRDMEQELEELAQQRQELVEGIVENLGGTYDVRGFAREWVDAWVDAFKETGDGLNGLKDNFHEFMQNIILEQAVMQGVGNIIKPLTDTITESLEDDYMISDAEWNKIWSQADSSMNLANQYITEFFERYPDMLKEASSSELEGLQAGIKGITEDTAQALESLLNSIRFYVAQQHENIADLAKRVFSNDDFDNPMLAQLRIIANQTSAINSLLTSVSTGGHSMGGKGLKVFIS